MFTFILTSIEFFIFICFDDGFAGVVFVAEKTILLYFFGVTAVSSTRCAFLFLKSGFSKLSIVLFNLSFHTEPLEACLLYL